MPSNGFKIVLIFSHSQMKILQPLSNAMRMVAAFKHYILDLLHTTNFVQNKTSHTLPWATITKYSESHRNLCESRESVWRDDVVVDIK